MPVDRLGTGIQPLAYAIETEVIFISAPPCSCHEKRDADKITIAILPDLNRPDLCSICDRNFDSDGKVLQMAQIVPFRGILYNTEKIEEMANVVVPPFDVISREDQQSAYDCHPHNMIRLELNRGPDNGSGPADPHLSAAAHFESWLKDGILVRDAEPAFYLAATGFQIGARPFTRFGFISRVRLTDFDEGIVLPHEKTFSRVRGERLELMKACHANFSPIFAMYADPGDALLKGAEKSVQDRLPEIDFVDGNGHRHRLWRLVGEDLTGHMAAALKDRRLYIADGHHRYETALAYRRWMQEQHGPLPDEHPANYVMMYLTAMESDGLVILPAHRLLKSVSEEMQQRLLDRAPDFFEVAPMGRGIEALKAAMAEHGGQTRIGVVVGDPRDLYLLRLREGIMAEMFADSIAPELIDIDVTVLTQLILMEILGFDRARLDDERLIGYASTYEQGISKIYDGQYDIGFLLNPTPIEQVRRVADAGRIMPRKATYFYPKVISGLVLNSLIP